MPEPTTFGVNPGIQGVVDRLAGTGYLALAPEFYHRHAAAGRWLERDDAGRTEGFALLHQLRRDQALATWTRPWAGWGHSRASSARR